MPDIQRTIDTVLAADEQPATVTIYQPDGEPYLAGDGSPATMDVLGAESKKVRAAQDKNLRRYVRSRGRGQHEADIARQGRVERATAAVVAWHGWEIDGQPAPCTPEHLETVFRAQHILEQVEEAITEHARFFTKSSPS
jgi:hypothetical protein